MRSPAVVLGLVLGSLLTMLPSTAGAETASRRDPRNDAPAGIDITRVDYTHAFRTVSARVRVPELARTGRVALSVSKFEIFEAGYVAIVRRRSDGTLSRRLMYFDHFSYEPRPCSVGGSWNVNTGVVVVSVPRSCLDRHRENRMYLAARSLRRADVYDDAPAVVRLRRG